jgi:hypothetical protein
MGRAVDALRQTPSNWSGSRILVGVRNVTYGTGANPQYFDTVVPIPAGWTTRVADNGKGIVFQSPNATSRNANSIRIMDPTSQYPNGYVRFYNSRGQPLDVPGKPGDTASTHIPLEHIGNIIGWPR